jgi:L-rhamnonate dehydratase
MRIQSVHAAAVTDPAALGRRKSGFDQALVSSSMNPMGHDARYESSGERFRPPWDDVACVVTAEDGTWGLGMTSHAGPVVPLINDFLGPIVTELDAGDVEHAWDVMALGAGSHLGLSGVLSYAISAVDLALWDLLGKLESAPVYELLEGPAREALDCYATGSDIAGYRNAGFSAMKLPCPWGSDVDAATKINVDRFTNARAIVGSDVLIRVDGWAIQTANDAIALGEALTPHGVDWIEDYVFPEDWAAYAKVRRSLPNVRLASGERWYGVAPFRLAIEQGYVDIVQPDALWVGGATPTRRIAALAEEAGVELALHCTGNDPYGQHLGLALAANTTSEMYYGGPIPDDLMATLRPLPGMAPVVDGTIVPRNAPGFGIELALGDVERATA